jgi:hypothetical protein
VDKIYKSDEWETLVPMTELQPGYDATRMHLFPVKDTNKVGIIWLHLWRVSVVVWLLDVLIGQVDTD